MRVVLVEKYTTSNLRDPSEIAQQFNAFFSEIEHSLAQKILPSEKNPEDFIMSPICN